MDCRLKRIFVSVAFLLLAACGGGGGGGQATQTGSVGLVLTDNPSDYFDEILVTVSCVRLLGDDGPVTIFSGEESFDLLRLREVTELFAVNDEVPVGTYSKIRLCVEKIELVRRDDQGNEISREVRRLLGNGKLDLSPRGDFRVRENEALLIQADFDADKSIKFNGQPPDNLSLRPVVFVRIIGADLPALDKPLRLHGVVTELNRELSSFLLCNTHFVIGAAGNADADFADGRDGCVRVVADDDTAIFDTNGTPVGLDQLFDGDEATVFGRVWRPELLQGPVLPPDAPWAGVSPVEDRPRITVLAALIEQGPIGTFRRLRGTATDGVDGIGQFPFELDPGQGFASMTEIPVQVAPGGLVPGTKILASNGEPVGEDAIVAGARALVRGVISLDPNLVNASLIVLQAAPSTAEQLSGVIVAVESDGSGLRLLPDDASAERCVRADASTETFLIAQDSGGPGSSGMVPLTRALETLMADVYGSEAVDGCFEAATIIAFDEAFPGF